MSLRPYYMSVFMKDLSPVMAEKLKVHTPFHQHNPYRLEKAASVLWELPDEDGYVRALHCTGWSTED